MGFGFDETGTKETKNKADYTYPINTSSKTYFRTGLSASLLDGAAFVPGKFGSGVEIASTNTKSRVQVSGDGVDIGDDWSVSVWFKELYPKSAWRTLVRGKDTDHQVIIQSGSDSLVLLPMEMEILEMQDQPLKSLATTLVNGITLVAVGTGGQTKLYVDGSGRYLRQTVHF